MKTVYSFVFVFLSTFAFAADEPTKLNIGIYVKFLSISNKDACALLDFYYWYRFDLPKDTTGLSEYYKLEFVNGDIIFNEIQEEKIVGNQFYVSGRIKGNFHFITDYVNYPFDRQKLLIQIEHQTMDERKIILVPDVKSYLKSGQDKSFWGLTKGLRSEGFVATKSDFLKSTRVYETDFGDPTIKENHSNYSNLTYHIYVSRDYSPYVLKFLLPLIIILSLAYLVFYIPAQALEIACSLTVTSLLAGIAFQWTISNDLHNVGYLTCVDKIFYLSYLLIMLAMAQTIWAFYLDKNGNIKLSNRLEIAGRFMFPFLFFLGVFYFIYNSIY